MRVALLAAVFLLTSAMAAEAVANDGEPDWQRIGCAEMGFASYPGMMYLIDRFGPGECSRAYTLHGRFTNVLGLWKVGTGSHFWMFTSAPHAGRVYFRAGAERKAAERLREWLRETSEHETNVSELQTFRTGYFFTYELDVEKPIACFMYSRPMGTKHRGYSSQIEIKQCRDSDIAWSVPEVEEALGSAVFNTRYE